jgi:hypothetical protein
MSDETEMWVEVAEVVEHEDGSATYSFETDETTAKSFAEFGLKVNLYCAVFGVDREDLFHMIKERGEYLSQDPDVPNFVRGF